MTDLQKILKQNEAIVRRLDKILESQKQWVRASVIQELTGWDGSRMKKARRDGSIQWKQEEDGKWYDLKSLNQVHLINQKETA